VSKAESATRRSVTADCESKAAFSSTTAARFPMIGRLDTIEEYKIIESQDLGSLAEKVNAALKEGWQPHGAPCSRAQCSTHIYKVRPRYDHAAASI